MPLVNGGSHPSVEFFQGEKYKCGKEIIDPEICNGPCEFKMDVLTGKYIKKKYDINKLAALDVLINGVAYSLSDFKLTKNKEEDFDVEIDLRKMVMGGVVMVEFHLSEATLIFDNVSGFDFTKSCSNKSVKRVINVTPRLNIDLEMLVKGRNI